MSLNLDKSTWQTIRFGDVVAASKTTVDPADGAVDRYIAGEHMDTDDLQIHRWGEVGEGYLGPAFHRQFVAGQVLYGSRRTYLRKVAVADFNGVTANTTFVLETSDPTRLRQDFLPWIMTSEPFHAYAIQESKGSVNPYINFSDLAKFEFAVPPLGEQLRLADLLWAAENHRRALVEIGTELQRGRGTIAAARLEGAPTVKFRELWSKSPDSGWSAPPVDADTGAYVLSLAALTDAGYRVGQLKSVNSIPETKAAVLNAGDLLISRANTIDAVGRAAVFPEDRNDVSFPDTMMRLHVDQDRVTNQYVADVMMSPAGRGHVRRTAAGTSTSMLKINRKTLGDFDFPLLQLDAQRIMRAELDEMDASLENNAAAVGATRDICSSILQEVFG